MADIIEEINKIGYERRRKYFMYKNKIRTRKGLDYGSMTKEEFMKYMGIGEEGYRALELWENSQEYIRLQYILYENNFDADLLEVYDSIKEEAKKGNATAVKTMIDLQKEVQKRLKQVSKDENKPKLDLNI